MAKKQFGSIRVSRSIVILFIIICGVFILSCGVSMTDPAKIGPAKILREKALTLDQENGFTALAVCSLRIEDQTGQLKGKKPKFSIGPVGATERICTYLKTGKMQTITSIKEYMTSHANVEPIVGSWTEKNGQVFYSGFFVIQLRAGQRQIFQILLESKSIHREEWINIPLNATCRVEQGKVYDLDLLKIVITEKMKRGRGKNFYRYSIHTPAKKTTNKERLAQLYPSLALPMNSVVGDCSFIIPACDGQ